jgi:hypothetical protein
MQVVFDIQMDVIDKDVTSMNEFCYKGGKLLPKYANLLACSSSCVLLATPNNTSAQPSQAPR